MKNKILKEPVFPPRVKKGSLEPNLKENYFHGGEEKWTTVLAKRKQKSLTLSCLSVIFCVEKIIFQEKESLEKFIDIFAPETSQ